MARLELAFKSTPVFGCLLSAGGDSGGQRLDVGVNTVGVAHWPSTQIVYTI